MKDSINKGRKLGGNYISVKGKNQSRKKMAMRLFKSQLENWYEMDFCDPNLTLKRRLNCKKKRGGEASEMRQKPQ
jgi:hypothetical protein